MKGPSLIHELCQIESVYFGAAKFKTHLKMVHVDDLKLIR